MVDYKVAADAAVTQVEGLLETFSALLRIMQVTGLFPRAGFRAVNSAP